jgi:hypothetical protein
MAIPYQIFILSPKLNHHKTKVGKETIFKQAQANPHEFPAYL